jgi:hypothetical protein
MEDGARSLPEGNMQGGAAPAERRCRRLREGGTQCRNWAIRGRELCYKHGRYYRTRADRPIEVPLLDDEDAITLASTQAVRALAWGTIPAANGRAILAGCRVALELLTYRLAAEKLRTKRQQLGLSVEEPAVPLVEIEEEYGEFKAPRAPELPAEPGAEPEKTMDCGAEAEAAPSLEPERAESRESLLQRYAAAPAVGADEDGETRAAGRAATGEREAEPAAERAWAPQTEPVPHFHLEPQFRDLKVNWDRALQRAENEVTEHYSKRAEETREDRVAALVRPWDGEYPRVEGVGVG